MELTKQTTTFRHTNTKKKRPIRSLIIAHEILHSVAKWHTYYVPLGHIFRLDKPLSWRHRWTNKSCVSTHLTLPSKHLFLLPLELADWKVQYLYLIPIPVRNNAHGLQKEIKERLHRPLSLSHPRHLCDVCQIDLTSTLITEDTDRLL